MPESTEPPTRTDTAVEVAQALVSKVPVVGDALMIVVRDSYPRRVAKAEAVAMAVAEQVGGAEQLAGRLEQSPELEALFFEAVEAGARTGLEDKRRLLGRVVAAAVLDDAKVEPGQLLVQALHELDAPHLRALEAVRRAYDEAVPGVPLPQADAWEEDEEHRQVRHAAVVAATQVMPPLVRATLERTGTLHVGPGMLSGPTAITAFGRELLADLRNAGAP